MNVLKKNNKKLWVDKFGKYNGIKMIIDERNETMSLPFDLTQYKNYVSRGGMLTKDELQQWEWSENVFEEA
jgi:hypothetical protein